MPTTKLRGGTESTATEIKSYTTTHVRKRAREVKNSYIYIFVEMPRTRRIRYLSAARDGLPRIWTTTCATFAVQRAADNSPTHWDTGGATTAEKKLPQQQQ